MLLINGNTTFRNGTFDFLNYFLMFSSVIETCIDSFYVLYRHPITIYIDVCLVLILLR